MHTKVFCPFLQTGLLDIIDEWAARMNTNRIRAAERLITVTLEQDVKVHFDQENICILLPKVYVAACRSNGNTDTAIITDTIMRGTRIMGSVQPVA